MIAAEVAHASGESPTLEATRALADHAYAAESSEATRRRQASMTRGGTPSTSLPAVVPGSVGPHAKRRRFKSSTP